MLQLLSEELLHLTRVMLGREISKSHSRTIHSRNSFTQHPNTAEQANRNSLPLYKPHG